MTTVLPSYDRQLEGEKASSTSPSGNPISDENFVDCDYDECPSPGGPTNPTLKVDATAKKLNLIFDLVSPHHMSSKNKVDLQYTFILEAPFQSHPDRKSSKETLPYYLREVIGDTSSGSFLGQLSAGYDTRMRVHPFKQGEIRWDHINGKRRAFIKTRLSSDMQSCTKNEEGEIGFGGRVAPNGDSVRSFDLTKSRGRDQLRDRLCSVLPYLSGEKREFPRFGRAVVDAHKKPTLPVFVYPQRLMYFEGDINRYQVSDYGFPVYAKGLQKEFSGAAPGLNALKESLYLLRFDDTSSVYPDNTPVSTGTKKVSIITMFHHAKNFEYYYKDDGNEEEDNCYNGEVFPNHYDQINYPVNEFRGCLVEKSQDEAFLDKIKESCKGKNDKCKFYETIKKIEGLTPENNHLAIPPHSDMDRYECGSKSRPMDKKRWWFGGANASRRFYFCDMHNNTINYGCTSQGAKKITDSVKLVHKTADGQSAPEDGNIVSSYRICNWDFSDEKGVVHYRADRAQNVLLSKGYGSSVSYGKVLQDILQPDRNGALTTYSNFSEKSVWDHFNLLKNQTGVKFFSVTDYDPDVYSLSSKNYVAHKQIDDILEKSLIQNGDETSRGGWIGYYPMGDASQIKKQTQDLMQKLVDKTKFYYPSNLDDSLKSMKCVLGEVKIAYFTGSGEKKETKTLSFSDIKRNMEGGEVVWKHVTAPYDPTNLMIDDESIENIDLTITRCCVDASHNFESVYTFPNLPDNCVKQTEANNLLKAISTKTVRYALD